MKHWSDTYPHDIFASVLLIDNKIMRSAIGQKGWTPAKEMDFSIQSKKWTVSNAEGHQYVLNIQAPEYFKQWELSDDFKGAMETV